MLNRIIPTVFILAIATTPMVAADHDSADNGNGNGGSAAGDPVDTTAGGTSSGASASDTGESANRAQAESAANPSPASKVVGTDDTADHEQPGVAAAPANTIDPIDGKPVDQKLQPVLVTLKDGSSLSIAISAPESKAKIESDPECYAKAARANRIATPKRDGATGTDAADKNVSLGSDDANPGTLPTGTRSDNLHAKDLDTNHK